MHSYGQASFISYNLCKQCITASSNVHKNQMCYYVQYKEVFVWHSPMIQSIQVTFSFVSPYKRKKKRSGLRDYLQSISIYGQATPDCIDNTLCYESFNAYIHIQALKFCPVQLFIVSHKHYSYSGTC